MSRNRLWSLAFLVVAGFVLAGAFLDRDGQVTWALVSVLVLIGAVVLAAIYLAVGALQRLVSWWPRSGRGRGPRTAAMRAALARRRRGTSR